MRKGTYNLSTSQTTVATLPVTIGYLESHLIFKGLKLISKSLPTPTFNHLSVFCIQHQYVLSSKCHLIEWLDSLSRCSPLCNPMIAFTSLSFVHCLSSQSTHQISLCLLFQQWGLGFVMVMGKPTGSESWCLWVWVWYLIWQTHTYLGTCGMVSQVHHRLSTIHMDHNR